MIKHKNKWPMVYFICTTSMLLLLPACSSSRQGAATIPPAAASPTVDPTPQAHSTPTATLEIAAVSATPNSPENQNKINHYCQLVDETFHNYGWGEGHCKDYAWKFVRDSHLGRPLIWAVFGNEEEHQKSPKDTTMVFCGVHGDEITPIKFCFDIIDHLREHFTQLYPNKLIIIAPIVNPDSFFNEKVSRTNHRGVDINRNFPTKDWKDNALPMWSQRYRADKRRFPGTHPMSEPEVVFQVNLIKRYNPGKIISVHAPLTMLDYDGATVSTRDVQGYKQDQLAKKMLQEMSRMAADYRVKNYPTFPGSLGNWAGRERNIPTFTLELPTSDARNSRKYWELFKGAIQYAFINDLKAQKKISDFEVLKEHKNMSSI